jgi:hypothetical protein
MNKNKAVAIAESIYGAATAILKIHGLGRKRWKRNVAKGARIGPWLQADYQIIDEKSWRHKTPCLYLVAGNDKVIRYVGISRNGLKHRWRTSPAYDADSMIRLPQNQLFHSQCWKHIELESVKKPGSTYEVRSITATVLIPILERLGPPVSAFAALRDDGESVVASVERWLCNHRSIGLLSWNVAMTGGVENQ